MLKERRAAAMKVASKLRAVEDATQVAMIAAAELNSTMLIARAEANISVMVGQDALNSAAAAYASFVEGMRHLAEAHVQLRATQTVVGLDRLSPREIGFGDTSDCPPVSPPSAIVPSERLRVVA